MSQEPEDASPQAADEPQADGAAPEGCPSRRRLADYAEGDLPAAEAEAVAAHLAACPRCRDELERVREGLDYCAETQGEVVEDVLRRLGRRPRRRGVRSALLIVGVLAVGLAGGCGLYRAVDHLLNAELRVFWQALATPEIVVGNARVRTTDGQDRGDYIGLGDVESIAAVHNAVSNVGDEKGRIRLRTTAAISGGLEDLGPSVCLLGGPAVNRLTLAALARARGVDANDPNALTAGFRFVAPPGSEANALMRICKPGEGVGIEDVATGRLCPYDARTGRDCALVVRTRLGERQFLIIAGYMGPGGYAAARAVTRTGDVLTRIQETFQRTGHAEAVLAVGPDGKAVVWQVSDGRGAGAAAPAAGGRP